jgi:NADPH:quinone reductase-like Zn-dependent oxidoreductase
MTSSSNTKLDEVKTHLSSLIRSPDYFAGINRREHREWDKEVSRLTDGKLGDFLLEIGGMKTLPSSIRSVKQGGLIALTGYLSTDEGGDDKEGELWIDRERGMD